MQSIQSYSPVSKESNLPPTQQVLDKAEPKESAELEAKRKTEALDRQKIFESGAASGSVVRTNAITMSAEAEKEIVQVFADAVEQVIKNPQCEAEIGRAQEETPTPEKYTAEEKAIFDYLVELCLKSLKPLLQVCTNPLLSKATDESIERAIRKVLQLDLVQTTCKKLKTHFSGDLKELVALRRVAKAAPVAEKNCITFQMGVLKEVVQDPMLLMHLVKGKLDPEILPAMKKELEAEEKSLNPEEKAFSNYLSTAIYAEYKPLVAKLAAMNPLLAGITDEAILLAIKKVFLPKVREKTKELAQIAPEHLQKMVQVAKHQEHILALGLLEKKIDGLEKSLLSDLKTALTSSDKEALPSFFATKRDKALLAELEAFLKNVPSEIHASLIKGLVEGIAITLSKKS